MSFPKYFDRVIVSTTTTGTGTYGLGSAANGYQDFGAAGANSGDLVGYFIVDSLSSPSNWELGEGVWTSGSPATLSRATIGGSSNGGLAVSWAAGPKYVFSAPAAARLQPAAWIGATGLANLIEPPQGRLTLTSGVAIMIATATAQGSIYYAPDKGRFCPVYDGTRWNYLDFTQSANDTVGLTLALDSASGHAGYHQSGKLFDLFVFSNSGAATLGTGPAWSSGTARGTGAGTTELQRLNGVWTNKNSITLRFGTASGNTVTVAANEATYIGSFYATADGQTGVTFVGAAASGGSNGVIGLSNAYNRVSAKSSSTDSASWTYATATWRAADNSNSNRVTFIDGLQQSEISAFYSVNVAQSSGTIFASIGVDLDSTSATPAFVDEMNIPTGSGGPVHNQHAHGIFAPQLGLHFVQAVERVGGGGTAGYNANGIVNAATLIVEVMY